MKGQPARTMLVTAQAETGDVPPPRPEQCHVHPPHIESDLPGTGSDKGRIGDSVRTSFLAGL